MKSFFLMSVLVFSFSAFAQSQEVACEVVESQDEQEVVILSKASALDLASGSTYLELGSYKNVTFNAVAINDDFVLLYAKVNGVSMMSQVKGEGQMNVFADGSDPLTFSCKFK